MFAQLSERLRAVYGRYSTYVDMTAKLLAALIVFFWIRSTIGVNSICSNPFLLLVLALLCAVFPATMIPVIAGVLVTGNAFSIGLDAGAITLVVFLILVVLFLRFVPDDAPVMVLVPLTMFFGFGPLVPILCGLKRRLSSVFAVLSGVTGYYLMAMLSRESKNLKSIALAEYATRLKLIIGGTFSATMVCQVISLMAVVIIVHAIRRLGFSYAPQIAVITGGIVYLMFVVLGNAMLGASVSLGRALIGDIASVIASLILALFMMPLDYTKTEHLEFEDDDYYYYVRAIPKASATKAEMKRVHPEAEEETVPAVEKPDLNEVDFEKKLEDSLKNL